MDGIEPSPVAPTPSHRGAAPRQSPEGGKSDSAVPLRSTPSLRQSDANCTVGL